MEALSGAIALSVAAPNVGALAWSAVIARRGGKGRDLAAFRRRAPPMVLNVALIVGGAVAAIELFPQAFTSAWPGAAALLGQVAFLVLADDFAFYFIHRWMHRNRRVYNAVHRLHHEAVHPLPCDYLYAHPAEWGSVTLAGSVAALGVIALFTGSVNGWAVAGFQLVRVTHEIFIHSGTPSTLGRWIPGLAPNEHHAGHHAAPHSGNFGSTFLFWDRLLGTEATPRRS